MERLYWISMARATFGLVVEAGTVTQAPPIARWTMGKKFQVAYDHYRKQGATILACEPAYQAQYHDQAGQMSSVVRWAK